jgi:hypothetical protein
MQFTCAVLVCLATALVLTSVASAAAGDDATRPGPAAAPASGGVPPLPEGDAGIAARYPLDREIARDPAVLFHDDFEPAGHPRERWDMAYHDEQIRVVDAAAGGGDPADVHGGARSLQFTVPRQDKELANALVKRLTPGDQRGRAGHDVVFLRYYSKFDPGFDQTGSSHNGAMLAAFSPGLPYATPGIRADGRNKFAASLECWRENAAAPPPGGLNVYVYHPGQRSQWGDHLFPSGTVLPNSADRPDYGPAFVPRPDHTPPLGRWHCHELMLQANTPGRRDGRIAFWVDGKLAADFPNLHLRDDADLKISHAELGLHIGSNRVRENKKWYDDVVIATAYIGPKVAAK